jgi:hypothetical protein
MPFCKVEQIRLMHNDPRAEYCSAYDFGENEPSDTCDSCTAYDEED